MAVTIKLRGDTAANWTTANPVLADREIGLEKDTKKYKVGDGVTAWDQLEYWGEMPDHAHDDLYYTESEVDSLLAGKSDAGHNHNNLYYTEAEVNGLLAGKSDAGHNHNNLYYTEAEVDSLLAGVDADTVDGRHWWDWQNTGSLIIRTSNQSLAGGVWTTINYTQYIFSNTSFAQWDNGTALYCKKPGWYLLWANIQVSPSSNANNLAVRILQNGGVRIVGQDRKLTDTGGGNPQICGAYYINYNDYIQCQALCAPGGGTLSYGWPYRPVLGMIYLGPT